MDQHSGTDCQSSYDLVADEYVARIFDELTGKPLDRQLLDRFAEAVRDVGPACDMGCGPGQIARYLHERSVTMCGVDLSPAMIERARRLTPGIEFQPGNMLALNLPDETWAGMTAFYSLIHIARTDMPTELSELRRVLKPDGLLLIAFHIGDETRHLDEWWGHPVNVDFHCFRPDEMTVFLRNAGFEIEEVIERDPYPEVEHRTRRCYIFARRPLMASGGT